jgi:DNA-directed RNA polymerase specialized sigma24 family protein
MSESTRALLFASYSCGNRHHFVSGGRAPETCPREDCDAGIEAVYQEQNGQKLPDPPDGADDDTSDAVRELARRLAAPDVVTERQAVAYVLRDVEGVGREDAADRMGCSVSNLDSLLGRARSNLDDARTTLSVLHELDHPPALVCLDE